MSTLANPDESETIMMLANDLDRETDRALAIITTAHLDDLLERLISITLHIPNPSAHKVMFEGINAPLSTFNSKIELLKACQILSEDEAHDLHLMRKIRNDFAHELIGISFETPSVRDKCHELRAARGDGDLGSARDRFKKATIRLIVDITIRIKGATHSA